MKKLVVGLIGLTLAGLPVSPAKAQTASCLGLSANWVKIENQRTGSPRWSDGVPFRLSADFSRRKPISRIEGYFDKTSLRCNESARINLVGAKRAVVEIYRMGYYKGSGARLITKTEITNGWKFSADKNYLPGQYLFKLISPKRASTLIPLVINRAEVPSALTLVSSVLTWQSYNQWGGYSLYKGPDGKRETRASEVSFSRPYDGDGSGQLRYMELPIISSMEKLGIPINYATDLDLDFDKNLLVNTKSVVFGGHSEYWTTKMRAAVETAVDRGVNLIVLGGNTAYNQMEISGQRISILNSWRNFGNPEISLLGSQYLDLGFHRDMVIETNQWPFDILPQGSVIRGVVGFEADTPVTFNGPPVETIARSSILPNEKTVPAMATYYTRKSGAGVLNMATNGWVCAIEDRCPWGHRFDRTTQDQIRAVTENILKGAARGPLGNWRVALTQNNARS